MKTKTALNNHVHTVLTENTGGGCMVDFFMLTDNTFICITEEVIGFYKGNSTDDLFGNEGIEHLAIDHIGDEFGDNSGGCFFVDTYDIATDDSIIFYDLIRLKNGIVVVIDDNQITVFKTELDYQYSKEVVGIIYRF